MKLLLLAGVYFLLFLTCFVYVLTNSIGFNALSHELDAKRLVFSLVPQGWAFFTKNPREEQTIIYRIANGKAYPADFKHNSFRRYLGLNRSCTKIFTEIEYAKVKVAKSKWLPCKWNYQTDSSSYAIPQGVTTIIPARALSQSLLAGDYLVVMQPTIPWAWNASIKTEHMPARAIRVNIVPSK